MIDAEELVKVRFTKTTNDTMKTKNITHVILLSAMAAASPMAFSQDAATEKPKMEEKATVQKGSLPPSLATASRSPPSQKH